VKRAVRQGLWYHRYGDSRIRRAVAAAKQADVAVLVLGEAGDMSGEAASRADIDLPGVQPRLLEAISATGTPVVLVIMNGRRSPYRGPRSTCPPISSPGFSASRMARRSPPCCSAT